jgi:hypothetical protein
LSTDSLPTVNLESFSFANMKASMEQQMPKQILGLGYQQRFQVRLKNNVMIAFLYVIWSLALTLDP